MSMREETRIIQLVTSIIFMITMIICIVGVSSVFYKPRIASLLSVLSVVGLSISITIQNSAQSLLGLTIPISLLLASSVMSWIAGRQASY
jgi:small-conductance mechanosensitive channel